MNLSNKDMRLVFELDSNYRKPYSRIGKKIRMSQQLVSYKVKSLSSNGIIVSNFPLIDYSRFGYLNFRVYFKVNYANRKKFSEMVSEMKKHFNITSIMECDWRYDLIVTFTTKNPSYFNKKLRELISDNPEQLKNCMILTTVVEHHYPRKYLVGYKNYSDTVIGGDRENINMDHINRSILKALLSNRKSVMEISKQVSATPKTVMARLKKLEKNEIIRGYRMLIDTNKMGFVTNKILIKYHNISIDRERELKTFCYGNPNITELIKTFGEWDLEITVETRNQKDFRNLCMNMREEFEDIISDFDKFSIVGFHKKSTIPKDFFEN
jgi:Lrp/AsnC family leucine-responsive transcriptional regulator